MNDKMRGIFAAIPFVLGTIAFLAVAGPRILSVQNIAWLANGDPAQHFLGWDFFRTSEWDFPLGLNPNFGLNLGSSIVFSDSIPLLAVPLKLLDPVLPHPFQYFGLWVYACFVLQAWFGWKIAGLLTTQQLPRFFAAGLFVFSPPMIWRLHGHMSLVGHFLILAALYLSLRRTEANRRIWWTALVTAAALVHAYIFVMVGLLWLANLAHVLLTRKCTIRASAMECCVMIAVVALACWQAGYFVFSGGLAAAGYGHYRMNLLSIVDSSGWSYLLGDIPQNKGEYEGFNFLGLGVIFIAMSLIPALLRRRVEIKAAIRTRRPLLFVLLGLALFAVSNRIGIGPYGFRIPLPDPVLDVANLFQSSGRMFWPVFYSIIITLVFALLRAYGPVMSSTLLAIAFVLQAADTSAGWLEIRRNRMVEPSAHWATPLQDPFWDIAATRYRNVRWIMPINRPSDWSVFASYAADHRLGTDVVYLARMSRRSLRRAQREAAASLDTGRYEADSLYILDPKLVSRARAHLDAEHDLLMTVDGFNVLAPRWKQ